MITIVFTVLILSVVALVGLIVFRKKFLQLFRLYLYIKPKRWWRKGKYPKSKTAPGPSVAPIMGPPAPASSPVATLPTAPIIAVSKPLDQPFSLAYFWAIVVIIMALWLCANVVLGIYFSSTTSIGTNPGLISTYLQLMYVAVSFKIIKQDKIGARLFLGKPINNLSSGPAFIPLVLCSLIRAPRTIIQQEIPAEPELIWRSVEPISEKQAEEGFKPPIRITFRGIKGSAEPLEQELTTEVTPVPRWRINNLCRFLETIGSIPSAKRQIEDACVGFCTAQLSKMTLRQALDELESMGIKLRETIEVRVESWGITVDSAAIKQIPLTKDLNSAIQGVPVKLAEARQIVSTAQAVRTKLALEGKGRGEAEKAELGGRTAGLKRMAKALNVTSQEVLGAETARAISAHDGQTIIVGGGGFADLVGVATGVSKALQKPSVPTPPPTTSP